MSSDPDTTEPTGTVEAKWRLRAYRTWSIVGICIIIGIILYIAGIIWQAVAVLIVTALLVFLLHGFVNRLERHGIPRWGGTTIAFLLIIAVIIACFMVLIPAVVSQLTSFTQQLPKYLAQIQDFVTKASSSAQLLDGESINALLTQAVSFIRQQAGALASGLANGVMGGIVSVGNVILVTFISFLFIGASVLTQAQITKAKGDWYDKVEVVVWLCPDGTSQSANCASGKSPSANEITALQKTIRDELNDVVSNIDYVSKQDFYDNTFTKQYPNGEFQGRTLTADDMQDSLWLKLKDPTKYQVVSEVLSGKEGVEDVTDQRQIFDPVFAVLNRATAVTAVLAGVMVVVAILLTGTTIRMSAASRRTETEIMRYVGASNWTIRLPFILEGTIASLIGSVLSCLMLSAIVNVFVTGWLAKSVTWIPYVNQLTVLVISPFLVVGAILLSIIASTISLRRYLRA